MTSRSRAYLATNGRRIRAGLYEVVTPYGVVELLNAERGRWFLTYPGCRSADDEAPTLGEAVAACIEWTQRRAAAEVA